MAEQDDGQERTESPTPKREEDARRKGQIPRSRELNAAAVTMVSGGAILFFGSSMMTDLQAVMRQGLSLRFSAAMSPDQMSTALSAGLWAGFMAVMPVLLASFMAAIAAPMALGGWNFSTEALAPKFSKLNPLTGLGRVFSANGLVELLKSLLKFIVIAVVAVQVLRSDTDALLAMGHQSLFMAMQQAGTLCVKALLLMASGMLLIAGVDVPIQLWQHAKQLKMSREEIKQEQKESDGSPEVKGKIRRLQQEMAKRRMMAEVPTADVVITNPTHFAVALRYDDNRNRAPIVVAKGADEVAARIREIAAENKVPIFEAPPLARVLFRSVDLNREIPAQLYQAVAQVLTYVFHLRAYKRGDATLTPDRPKVEVTE